eukprot:521967-Alexandrium_andersonii.AAC.1
MRRLDVACVIDAFLFVRCRINNCKEDGRKLHVANTNIMDLGACVRRLMRGSGSGGRCIVPCNALALNTKAITVGS